MIDVSFLIVHYNTPGLLRQTLKGIISSAPNIRYEVIVVDNNPDMRVRDFIEKEFPEVSVLVSDSNLGFGGGMNCAIEKASGRYVFIFNPDIAVFSGATERLVTFMDENGDIGIVGPKLCNPDGSIQHSCYTFTDPSVIMYRRIPLLRSLPKAKVKVKDYLMADWDHTEMRDVDYLLGAAMFVRKTALDEVGGFDPNFFIYFEDQDLCRRFWLKNWRVVYQPQIKMIHYHRRETAEGSFLSQLFNPLTRKQIESALYYYKKYKGDKNPREACNSKKVNLEH